jgi:hypothetical protein
MSTDKAQCRDCQFWEEFLMRGEGMPARGFCLRYPPVPIGRTDSSTEGQRGEYRDVIATSVSPEWPETRENEWCGEYRKDDGA